MQELRADRRLGEMAAASRAALRVLSRHGLDFCCGGMSTLEEACHDAGLDVGQVLGEIRDEAERIENGEPGWQEGPLATLIDHIMTRFHEPLRSELDKLVATARQVQAAHRERHAGELGALAEVLTNLRLELLEHMQVEEDVLFPWVRSGDARTAGEIVKRLAEDHVRAAAHLARIRELTANFAVPDDACVTWRTLLVDLRVMDDSLREHIHLENNILFPRALLEEE